MRALLEAETPVVTLVGKTWDLHVTQVLETTLEENLAMLTDSIAYLAAHGRKVFLDAEHFFDGFKANPSYAVQCVRVAAEAGAAGVVLCDTNGGSLPNEVVAAMAAVREATSAPLGIHAHNDAEVAVANTLAAVQAGAVQVQGTINGYGERCGNANLLTIIANLKMKLGMEVVSDAQLASLTEVSHYVSEVVNMPPNPYQPYVGASAFVHKAGLHASAVAKVERSYQHILPQWVGNSKRVLVSELAGRSNVVQKLREMGIEAPADVVRDAVAVIKQRESEGFQYEGAEASFELIVRRALPGYASPFELVDFLVVVEKRRRTSAVENDGLMSEATVKVRVGDRVMHTAAEGNGPVNALDAAVRKGLLEFYPSLEAVRLLDYKVRVVDQAGGTGAVVRVLAESTDGETTWQTVGCSGNIIEASRLALQDSLEWWLLAQQRKG
jgi:2-isopropylmalate synthase